jgi:hypothetical protein
MLLDDDGSWIRLPTEHKADPERQRNEEREKERENEP